MLFTFLADPNATEGLGIFVKWVLPAVGIGVIAFCITSFFFPFGQQLKGTKQVIKGFGLDLEVSVPTLLLLIGVAMTFTGVYLQISNRGAASLNEKIRTLQTQLQDANDALKKAGRYTITADLLMPKDIKVDSLDVKNLECYYTLFDGTQHPAPISQGLGGNSLQIQLIDIQRNDGIDELVLREKGTRKVLGDARALHPLTPVFTLKSPQ